MDDESPLDHAALVAEIYADLDQRRRSGQITPALEAEIDAAFARVAPVAAIGGDARALIERAEDAASIDPHVPVDGSAPVTIVKRILRKSMFWYVAWITRQVGQFAGSIALAVRRVEERLSAVEAGRLQTPRLDAALARLEPRAIDPGLADLIVAHLASVRGPIVVGEAGAGGLVSRLRSQGHDVEGVEPRVDLVARAAGDGIALTATTVSRRLHALAEGSLDGLVILGVPDRSTSEQHLEIADLAGHVVGPSGRIALVSLAPAALLGDDVPVEVDLSPGRPLAASTWRHLLAQRGFDQIAVAEVGPSYCVTAVKAAP